jgi:hypothetical protein
MKETYENEYGWLIVFNKNQLLDIISEALRDSDESASAYYERMLIPPKSYPVAVTYSHPGEDVEVQVIGLNEATNIVECLSGGVK